MWVMSVVRASNFSVICSDLLILQRGPAEWKHGPHAFVNGVHCLDAGGLCHCVEIGNNWELLRVQKSSTVFSLTNTSHKVNK